MSYLYDLSATSNSAMTDVEKDMEFAERLVRLRLNLPLRNAKAVEKKEVAEEAGVSVASYSQAENGIIPGEKVLIKIARYFNVSEDYLLRGQEEDSQPGLAVAEGPSQYEASAEALAIQKVIEIMRSNDPVFVPAIQANLRAFQAAIRKDHQLSEQASEIKSLKAELKAIRAKFEARISALEDKPPGDDPEKDPSEVPHQTETDGQRRAVGD